MINGLARGFRGLAIATALAFAGNAIAQEAPAVAPPPVAAAATAVAGAVSGAANAASAAVEDAAATHAQAQTDALAGYTRMAPTPDIGQPIPRGIHVPDQVTPVGHEARFMLDYMLNPIILAITALVLALMLWVMVRYRSGAVEKASTTSHNFGLEVAWTLLPALTLVVIAFPSFRLLASQYNTPKADITLKVTGHQWYWSYEYPDFGDISFDSVMLTDEEAAKAGDPRLLDVDNRIVVPAGKVVKVLVTGADVIHSFAVPSFWVKIDAIPGKINETWFKVDRPGVYYGQCSELCGTKHGFMPIAVEVLPEEDFRRWVRMKQKEDGIEPTGPGIAVEKTALTPAQVVGVVRDAIAPAAPATTTEAPAAPAAAPAA